MHRTLAAAAALSFCAASAAWADDPASAAPDKSGFTLFNPTPDADLRGLCTDRPTKSTSPCTVDAGHWQLESDVYNVTSQTDAGVTTVTQLFTSPTLKLGVTNTIDVEANIVPYERITVHDSTSGVTTSAAGAGDLFLRAKFNLLGDDGGNVGFAIEPYVKIPTAGRVLGNGAVEEGVLTPIQLSLPANWQLVIDPEFDALANAVGAGRHFNTSSLLSFSYPATKEITVSLEVWGDANFDPTGTVKQASFDLGAAWIPAKSPTFQLDGGVNLGLNHATPGLQAYVGVSRRF
ncbi:MAG TPA: transporter [Caulobacteraceae bacterium]|nr:transporter [Caulobacteraceae bacterium]